MKQLVEKRNDLVAEMTNIVDTAKSENRAVTEEEAKQFENCKAEVQNIDKTINMEKEMENFENKIVSEPAKELTNKERDEKIFANIIRDIKNVDTPMKKADGQVTIPTSIAQRIIEVVKDICPIWSMAEHYNIKGNLSIAQEDATNSNLEMTYADEFTDADSTKTVIKNINLGEFLGRCLSKVSNSLINNSEFDIVTYVIKKVGEAVAKFLEKELLIGTTGKIEGLKGVTLQVIAGSDTAITADDLIDLQEEVIDAYQSNAIYIMNRKTRKAIRKLKDTEGNYLLNRDVTAKWGYTLLGKPVYTSDNMAEIGSEKDVVYYGDMTGLAVKISEDINIQILKEKYAEQHATGILAFVGCDAKVQNTQKIAKLTMGKTAGK